MRLRSPIAALAAWALLAGCSGSSTAPIEAPQAFQGELAFEGSEFHNFTVVSDGTLRIELTRLQEKVAEGAEPLGVPLTIGLGLGRPAGEQCSTRYSVRATEGDILVVGLTGAEFCVLVFDAGLFFPDLVAEYTVSVTAG